MTGDDEFMKTIQDRKSRYGSFMMKHCLNLCCACLILVGISTIRTAGAVGAEVVDRIVATVNDDIITLSELNAAYASYAEKIRTMNYPAEKEREILFEAREQTLNNLIDAKLSEGEVKRLAISVDEAEIDAAVERIKEKNFLSEEDMRELLKREGVTLEKYREQLKEQILRAKLVDREVKSNIIITREDVEQYYKAHLEEFSNGVRYHLRNIIMKFDPLDEEEKAKQRERMERILLRLKDGESFESLARSYSESSLAEQGGDLGVFNRSDLAPEIRTAVEKAPAGDFTEIVETDQGFQIFLVQEVFGEEITPLDKVFSKIEEKLYNQMMDERFKAWVAGLREKSHVKIIN